MVGETPAAFPLARSNPEATLMLFQSAAQEHGLAHHHPGLRPPGKRTLQVAGDIKIYKDM